MTADLSTNEFVMLTESADEGTRSALRQAGQPLHQYGRASIFDAPQPLAEEIAPAEAPMSDMPPEGEASTEQLGLAAFARRRSDEFRMEKENRSHAALSWSGEDNGEGPSPIHPVDGPEFLAEGEQPAPAASLSGRLKGRIAVGVVIVEGTASALRFSNSEQIKVLAEVQNGLSYLAAQAPRKDVTFVHQIKALRVDVPDTTSGSTYEDFERPWRDPALAQLGFGPGLSGCRAYAASLKTALATDWAYVAFFTKYTLRHFAYASLGGPRLVMHYLNDGWGVDNIDRVFAHETGHIFNAPDEYGSSGCNCGGSWGHFGRPNSNCANCAPGGGSKCIMRSNDWAMCSETPYHLGYSGLP